MKHAWTTGLVFAGALLCLPAIQRAVVGAEGGVKNYITRQGDKLMDGDKEWRAVGANMPGLILPCDFALQIPERMVLRLSQP
jgi:hypothetical protein